VRFDCRTVSCASEEKKINQRAVLVEIAARAMWVEGIFLSA